MREGMQSRDGDAVEAAVVEVAAAAAGDTVVDLSLKT
jgi:hypothetical protein